MAHWNYRIVKYHDGSGYGLHEVHYDDDGKPRSMTLEPATFSGETSLEVVKGIVKANADAATRLVLEEPEAWSTNRNGT